MKKLIIIALILFTGAAYGQKQIAKPLIVLDTTYQGVRSIYSWDGVYSVKEVDSTRQVSANTFVVEPGYFSLQHSYVQIPLTRTRIYTMQGGEADTLIRSKHIQVSFIDIQKAMSDLYGNNGLRKEIKKVLKQDYKNKISRDQ